jgi:hypothetical protein
LCTQAGQQPATKQDEQERFGAAIGASYWEGKHADMAKDPIAQIVIGIRSPEDHKGAL